MQNQQNLNVAEVELPCQEDWIWQSLGSLGKRSSPNMRTFSFTRLAMTKLPFVRVTVWFWHWDCRKRLRQLNEPHCLVAPPWTDHLHNSFGGNGWGSKDSIYLLSHHPMCIIDSSGQGSMVTLCDIMLKQSRAKNLSWDSSAGSKQTTCLLQIRGKEEVLLLKVWIRLWTGMSWGMFLCICFFNHSRILDLALYRESSLKSDGLKGFQSESDFSLPSFCSSGAGWTMITSTSCIYAEGILSSYERRNLKAEGSVLLLSSLWLVCFTFAGFFLENVLLMSRSFQGQGCWQVRCSGQG